MTINVLIVEDNIATLTALVQQCGDGGEITLRGYARDFSGAETLISGARADVIVLDLDLAGESALPLIPQAVDAGLKVLVLSNLGDQTSVLAAVRAGANGYVLKDDAIFDLPESIRCTLEGDAPISPGIASILLRQLRGSGQSERIDDFPELSKRELQILEALSEGMTYREIADQLHLSYHTVSDHTKSIYRKLQVNSRGQAVAKFFNSAAPRTQYA